MNTLMNLIITPAEAQATGMSLGGFDLMSIAPLALIFVVFYFFLIRPQQKKAQQQKDLLSSLREGDRVLTVGGLIGEVTKVISDQELQIKIAENVKVRVARAMVADRLSVTEVAPEREEKAPVRTVSKQTPKKAPALKKKAVKK